jgi:hypothetical protein
MKKLLLSFVIIVLFPFIAISQVNDKKESTYLKVKSGEDITTYEFHSIRDFEENSEKILDEIITTAKPNKKEKDDLLTIEISITINANNISTTITGSVTTILSSIIAEVKKLRTQLLAIAIG